MITSDFTTDVDPQTNVTAVVDGEFLLRRATNKSY